MQYNTEIEIFCLVNNEETKKILKEPWIILPEILREHGIVAQMVKNLPTVQEILVQFLGWEDPLERKWQPTPVFCLENSMDRGARQVTVHGVAKNQTQLNDFHYYYY